MSEEHGQLNLSDSIRKYRIGEKPTVIPDHVCTTINMHGVIYRIRGEEVEEQWRVEARGKVS
jgi:D-serine deaminase-like pyridoxal phosphate-dependent protein